MAANIRTMRLTPGQIAIIVEGLVKLGTADARTIANLVEDADSIVMAKNMKAAK